MTVGADSRFPTRTAGRHGCVHAAGAFALTDDAGPSFAHTWRPSVESTIRRASAIQPRLDGAIRNGQPSVDPRGIELDQSSVRRPNRRGRSTRPEQRGHRCHSPTDHKAPTHPAGAIVPSFHDSSTRSFASRPANLTRKALRGADAAKVQGAATLGPS